MEKGSKGTSYYFSPQGDKEMENKELTGIMEARWDSPKNAKSKF